MKSLRRNDGAIAQIAVIMSETRMSVSSQSLRILNARTTLVEMHRAVRETACSGQRKNQDW